MLAVWVLQHHWSRAGAVVRRMVLACSHGRRELRADSVSPLTHHLAPAQQRDLVGKAGAAGVLSTAPAGPSADEVALCHPSSSTGCFPRNHLLVMKSKGHAEHGWVSQSLYDLGAEPCPCLSMKE